MISSEQLCGFQTYLSTSQGHGLCTQHEVHCTLPGCFPANVACPTRATPLSSCIGFQLPWGLLEEDVYKAILSPLSHSFCCYSGLLLVGNALIWLPKRDNSSAYFETNNKIRLGLIKAHPVYSDCQRVRHRMCFWKPLFSPAELSAWVNIFMRLHIVTKPNESVNSFPKHLISCPLSLNLKWSDSWVNGSQ